MGAEVGGESLPQVFQYVQLWATLTREETALRVKFIQITMCKIQPSWFVHLGHLIELLKHNNIMLTRMRLPAKLLCHMYNLWLVSCSFLLSQLAEQYFWLSSSMDGPCCFAHYKTAKWEIGSQDNWLFLTDLRSIPCPNNHKYLFSSHKMGPD